MMLRRTLLLFVTTLLLGLTANATHISGGEIYYDCIGPNQFRITLVVYRDCAGINLNNSYTLNLNSPCGNRTLTVSTPGGTEISQLCDIALPNSTCNGGSLPGIQQYIYTGVITLPPCNAWTISWTEPWRNAAIANLNTPGNKNVYIQAVLNTAAAPCNDSPQFTNAAIPYVCAGYPISYSYGAFDPEGDSLTYTFISAMNTGAVPLQYNPGFSGTQPITGITLDPLTGLVNFTLNQIGNWVVVVRVDEYDANGQLIGSVMRDMQFVAYPCNNIPPDPTTGLVNNLSGASTQLGPRSVEICESGNFCFDMVISDPNAGDVLKATSNIAQNLPGATFSYTGTNPITCHVCWAGVPGASGFFPFIVTVNDGACPIPALQTYVYSIHVLPGLQVSGQVVNEGCAGDGNGKATVVVDVGTAPYTYLWNTGGTDSTITAGAGSYTVTVRDANGCVSAPYTATIGTQGLPNAAHAGADLIGCFGSLPVPLQGTVTNATGGLWSGGAGNFTGSGLNVTYMPTMAEVNSGGIDLYLTTTGNTSCPPARDTVHVTLPSSFFTSSISHTNALCNGTANGSATYLPNANGFTYLWNDPAAQTAHTATGLAAGNYHVRVTDGYGCDTTVNVTITQPAAITIANLAVTHEQCAGNNDGAITVTANGGTAPYHYSWNTGHPADTLATLTAGAGTYTVTVTDANGCAAAQGSATINALG
ncbi:MAG: SprB repeat-containing protein, partial [Bacteroidetes bacterium]|nr:SprB repeat-containing protein [Bacteroidota bacterium]